MEMCVGACGTAVREHIAESIGFVASLDCDRKGGHGTVTLVHIHIAGHHTSSPWTSELQVNVSCHANCVVNKS